MFTNNNKRILSFAAAAVATATCVVAVDGFVVPSGQLISATTSTTSTTTSASSSSMNSNFPRKFGQQKQDQQRLSFLCMADDDDSSWEAPKSAMVGGAGVNNAGEPSFEIRGFSLGNAVILSGVLITVLSFAEYLSDSGSEGLNVSGLGFVYGIPIFLAGAALKYAEIDPVPVYSTPAGERAFETKATETIQKIKQDVTRHRYGDEAHLDTTVKKLGLVVPGKDYPQLRELREEATEDGELVFTMVWQSIDTPYKMWADERRLAKYETFFGPGINADVVKIDAEQRLVGIRLTTKSKSSSSDATPTASSTETVVTSA